MDAAAIFGHAASVTAVGPAGRNCLGAGRKDRHTDNMSTRTSRPRRAKAAAIAKAAAVDPKKRKALAALAAEEALAAAAAPPPFSSFELQGRRDYMEDRVLAAAPMQSGAPFHFFGVYDGHGGAEASQYCKDHMVEAFAAHPKLTVGTVPAALRGAYARVDEEFCKIANASKGKNKIESGTTAVSVVLGANHFWVANTGDSRVVLVQSDGTAATLTIDHSPESKKEAARIRRAGGFIESDDGCHRVGGVLAVSRAIGDAYLKEFVICDPDVKKHKRHEKMSFLVLGSDGLWDDVTPDDVSMVLGVGGKGKVPTTRAQIQSCAKKLVKMAYKNGSEDNICCLIVDLRALPAPKPKKGRAEEDDEDIVDMTGASLSIRRAISIMPRGKKKR